MGQISEVGIEINVENASSNVTALTRIADAESLRKILAQVEKPAEESGRFKLWKGRLKNVRKAD